ncbi:MAG: ABC transporter permease [Geminicoccaceae bacterium]
MRFGLARSGIISLTGLAVLLPIALVVYQSALDAPFFNKDVHFSTSAFAYVLSDPGFWRALRNSLLIGAGMAAIAVPLGGILAFLLVRTDVPGRAVIEPLIIIPVLLAPIVLGLGYVVAAGPVGFYSVWTKWLLGYVPWKLYSPITIGVIGGLTHVPHVYLYTSSALNSLGSELEEAARTAGASPWRIARDVSLPMVSPALLFSGVLVFFAGVEMFGLALVLGNPSGFELLSVYLFKLTNRLGTPSYQLMAAVAVCIMAITFPLVMLQRRILRSSDRFVSVRGKSNRQRLLSLGKWRWVAFALILLWLFVAAVMPISGITLRAFVTRWGPNVELANVLTLEHFRLIFTEPALLRGIRNSVLIGIVGGGLAVACYTAIAVSVHRRHDGWTRFVDYLVLIPRAVPGLLAGLAFLWVFLFVAPLTPLRSTLFSVWIAYVVVWLAYGTRLITSALMQISPELEEAARSAGAKQGRVIRDVTLPLIRYGLLASWLLIFLMFEREYATGVYLLTAGTEVIGALLVSLSESGSMNIVAALSVVNIVLVGLGLGIALRFGVRLYD